MSDPAAPEWRGDPSRPGPLSHDDAATLLGRAWELATSGDWQEAGAAYARLVGNPDPEVHVAALLGLAETRYRLDDDPGALQAWLSAAQAPDTSNSWRAWKALAAARVREGDLPGAVRSYREALSRAPADERPEITGRLGWLSKELGDRGTSERYFSRARQGTLPTPVATYAILAVTVAIGLVVYFSPGARDLFYGLFALDKPAVAQGEWWRLVTVVLVHADLGLIFHLLFNMYALWILGPIIEALYGSVRFVAIYLLCAAAGSAASYLLSPGPLAVGASGAIFGLFGILFISDRVHRPALTRAARGLTAQVGMLIVVNLVIGFLFPFIDIWAHIGGLVAGAWLGYVLVPQGARLASFWQQPRTQTTATGAPGPAPAAQQPSAPSRFGGEQLLRLAGVLALVAVIVLAVGFGPGRFA